jgi:hypothetical protein
VRQQLAQFAIKTNLKQSEKFEYNHNNNNYSDYIEDASVHARESYQGEWLVASIYRN